MEENLTIGKKPTLEPSMDFDFLREEGLKHIESLAHELWTDYNTHDPGITILEVLCYAITELGYRSNFEMKDLVSGASDQTFFTARQILSSASLTLTDYRKLLVDIEGVSNAWLFTDAEPEVKIFANCEEDRLQYEPTANEIKLSGLYAVVLDLEMDLVFGDLNNGDIELENIPFALNPMVDIEAGEFMVKFDLPSIKTIPGRILLEEPKSIGVEINEAKDGEYFFTLVYDDGEIVKLAFFASVAKNPSKGKVKNQHIALMLENEEFVKDIFGSYQSKLSKADLIIKNAVRTLHAHRNLCEDFIRVESIESEEIAFCFDVDVSPATDIEKVQAEIYFAIENYLHPPVSFYHLKELMEKSIPVEKIFEGPRLNHGFIDTEEIENSQLRKVIYASDIINLIMDISGVEAVRNFSMTKYNDEGKPVKGALNITWCMPVSPMHKPIMNKSYSKILFFKDAFPFLSRYEEVKDTVAFMHARRSRTKVSGMANDLPIPNGRKRDTLSYWPAQYDLPMTYGVGEHGLPSNADSTRKGQQQQLKGYLMFFEQLLADFYTQLTYAADLFSTSAVTQTYFAQNLDGIKDIAGILDEDLAKAISNDPNSILSAESWQKLYESRDDFYKRRNIFLDHLLARFAESFNDYALLMYRINYENLSEEKIEQQEAIDIKIRTLKNYPEISYGRGLAFNYAPQKEDFEINHDLLWDSTNVSGLEKRISSLTGIKDFSRRYLYCIKNIEIICEEAEVAEGLECRHFFSLTTLDGFKLVSKKFENKEKAEEALVKVLEHGSNIANYHYTSKKIKLKYNNQILLESVMTLASELEADEEIEKLVAEMNSPCNDPEGLHLVEHLLLRPRTLEFKLMQVCLEGCDCLCESDPYTFRISVILPHWPGHFDNMAFRKYFEKRVREEAPAHIQVKVCWVSNNDLRIFESQYKRWLEALANFTKDSQQIQVFREANDHLIEIMTDLHSIYPKATLHDCEESDAGVNPVMLGKTILGTQK